MILIRFVSLVILIGLSLGCSQGKEEGASSAGAKCPPPQGQPAYGDLLIQGSIGDASNLIPMLASDSASHDISGLIFNGLLNTTRT